MSSVDEFIKQLNSTEKIKENIENLGFLTLSDKYSPTMGSPMEEVEANPEKYIIEECIPACRELWKNNIYTFMVSDHLNEGVCWIEVALEDLSDENKKIFEELEGEDVIKFSYHPGCVNFGVKCVGLDGQKKLLELASKFKMQDIGREGYVMLDDYLISRGCYVEVKNPDYVPMEFPSFDDKDAIECLEEIKKYNEWEKSLQSRKNIRVFSSDKMVKSVEEYLDETGAIYEGKRVFINKYHYDKHMNYVNYLEKKEKDILSKKVFD